MSALQISLLIGFVALIALLTTVYQGKAIGFLGIFCVMVVLMALWLWVVYKEQHSPHLITSSVGGRVISQFWVTNPACIQVLWTNRVTSNGIELVRYEHTNYFWNVWDIWK